MNTPARISWIARFNTLMFPVAGIPAVPISTWRRAQAAFGRLPELLRRLRRLEAGAAGPGDQEEDRE